MKKGDKILYEFGGTMTEAKIIKVYNDDYIRIKQLGDWFFAYKHIIHKSRIKAMANKK